MNETTVTHAPGARATEKYVARFEEVLGIVRVTTAIAASPTRLFEVLTHPAHFATWWGGDGTRPLSRAGVRRGGEWRVFESRRDHAEPLARGQYLIVEAPRVLAFTCLAARHDFLPTIVRCELVPLDLGDARATRLTLTHAGIAGRAELGAVEAGLWCQRLGRLEREVGALAD